MLKEIALSASLILNSPAYSQDISNLQNNSSKSDSLLIELLSKDYAIQDTTIHGILPIQKQKYESYKKLKENYSHPDRIDLLASNMMDTKIYQVGEREREVGSLLEEMLADVPGDSLTTFLIGECYKNMQDTEKATEYYKKAIQQGLENSVAYQSIADFKLDEFNVKLSQLNSMIEAAEVRGNKNLNSLKAMRRVFFKKTQELIPLYQKAIEIDPQNKAARYHLAELYSFINMPVEALNTINKTFEIYPTEIADYLHRIMYLEGEMLEKEGMGEELKEAIKKRYLKDVDIAYKGVPVLLYTAYGNIRDSKIFTDQEKEDFKEKYGDSFSTFLKSLE